MKIDTESKIPKYIQIRKWIMGMILRGNIKVGSKLPTEEELARRFGVNRMTVRQALDELVIEKMIIRKRGEGTILISDKPKSYVYELNNITSFNDDMESHGIVPIHRLLKKEVLEAEPLIAEQLELVSDKRVIYTLSVKYVGDEAVLIEHSYIPYQGFSRLMEIKIDRPFYHLLVEEFNVTLHHSTQIFSAVLSGSEENEIFNFSSSQPCMLLESITYDENDIPVEYLRSYYRGDRYRFKANSGEYLFSRGEDNT